MENGLDSGLNSALNGGLQSGLKSPPSLSSETIIVKNLRQIDNCLIEQRPIFQQWVTANFFLALARFVDNMLSVSSSSKSSMVAMIRRSIVMLSMIFMIDATASENSGWENTIESISSGIVSIRVDSTRAFDTQWYSSSQATGFIVDAERGIILTNRHVVTPGPVVAEAVFINHEEVRLTPIYRDPVHDFGFFRYNPKDLAYLKPAELRLVPEAAAIGHEIRVVGNDAGEKLSILAGTLARLDRKAPFYGLGKYNDFNTFYIQAASGTSGGSSGAPVVSINGDVVALSAGSNRQAASSFFLPLSRIKRALTLIQNQEAVTRGTLQTVFEFKTFDELKRLGLSDESEKLMRSTITGQNGTLTVKEVIFGSPAMGKIEPGDILLKVNGENISEFDSLAVSLDSLVGETIRLELERGGVQVLVDVAVTDLHSITPDEFLEFGGAIVNNLSYQQALNFNLPLKGVYVANPGYTLGKRAIPFGSILSEFSRKKVDNISDVRKQLALLADTDRTTIRYSRYEDRRNSILTSIKMDRKWFPARYCKRDDVTGLWPCEALETGPEKSTPISGNTRFNRNGKKLVNKLSSSLVHVSFDLPYPVSGLSGYRSFQGTGVVVDEKRGWVVVDRNTVPVAMGDVNITFAGSLQVQGKVEFLHPVHNLALVSYDPNLIGDTPVTAVRFDTSPLKSGDVVSIVGIKPDYQVALEANTVSSVDSLVLPLSRTMMFRDSNIETISLINATNKFDGVLVNKKGQVAALWSSFAYDDSSGKKSQLVRGISSELVKDFVKTVRSARPIYSLEVETNYVPLFFAKELGLNEAWQYKLEKHDPIHRRTLKIRRVVAGTPAAKLLKNGDLVLAVDGAIVTSFRQLERAVQKPYVQLTIWRGGEALKLDVGVAVLGGKGIKRAVSWAGALLQNPHHALAAQRGIEPSGVFVAHYSPGSPASRYGLQVGRRIVEVDGVPTPDLQHFLQIIAGLEDDKSVRLKTINWDRSVEIITLKMDRQYWPAFEIKRDDTGWHRFELSDNDVSVGR
ncbi:MAG: S1-C subfamily serine protease [Oceanicoccus sp.]|jgi:S1-C subfamily serine protease